MIPKKYKIQVTISNSSTFYECVATYSDHQIKEMLQYAEKNFDELDNNYEWYSDETEEMSPEERKGYLFENHPEKIISAVIYYRIPWPREGNFKNWVDYGLKRSAENIEIINNNTDTFDFSVEPIPE